MPYIKNKQQSFQAAQQAFVQAEEATSGLISTDEDFGHHLKQAEREIREAEQMIQKALRNASEHQRNELQKFEAQLEEMKGNLNQY